MISAKKTFAFLILLLDILALMTVAKEKLEATNKHIQEGLERYSVVSIAKTVREVNKGLWAEYDPRGRPTIGHGPRKCMDQSDAICRVRDYYKRCSDDSEDPKSCYTYEPRGFQWVMTRFYFVSDVPKALFGNGIGFYLLWGLGFIVLMALSKSLLFSFLFGPLIGSLILLPPLWLLMLLSSLLGLAFGLVGWVNVAFGIFATIYFKYKEMKKVWNSEGKKIAEEGKKLVTKE